MPSTPERPRQRTLDFPDGTVHLLDWGGEGQKILFTHANGFNAATYVPILAPLTDQAHLYASDLRGHGLTTLAADPESHKSWLTYRDDLIRVLETIGGGPFVLGGHSMGATSSLLVTAARPDLVKALVLFEPVAFDPPPNFNRDETPFVIGARKRRAVFDSVASAKQAYTGRGAFKTWPEETLDAYLSDAFKPDPEGVRLTCDPAWEAANFRLGPPPLNDAISAIRCPLTIFQGTEASTTGEPFLERVRAARPDAKITRIEGATHFLPMEQPDLVRASLLEALG